MEIKSNCNCGRFDSRDRHTLEAGRGEDVDASAGWFAYHGDRQVSFCDGCGEKIWVEEDTKKAEPFPYLLCFLEPDKPISTDIEVKDNRIAINRIMNWIQRYEEAKNGGD